MGDLDTRFYLSLLLRRLPYVAAIIAVFSLGGLALALFLPPLYRASAKILVEAPQIPTEMARSTVPTGAVEQFEIIEQEIITQDNLQSLATKLNIYGDKGASMSAFDIAEDMRERTRFEQVKLDSLRTGQGATVFAVSFDAKDPDLAARVVNELVNYVLSKNVSLRTGRAGDTMQFFDQEVARLGKELSDLEATILKFKNANKDSLPESLDFRRNQQSGLQDRLSQLEREEASLRSRRNNLVEMFQSTGKVANVGPLSPEQQMLADMNRALADQLTIFSETSPNIVALRARIAAMQDRLRANQATDAARKTGPSDFDIQLSDIDQRLSYLADERASITKNLDVIAQSIAATPGNETKLNALERTRTNIQAQYNSAAALQAQASTGEQIEARSKGGSFSVVEPSVAPEKPVSPNRLRIAGFGLASGIGLGGGLVVLLELMNKTIRRPAELAELLQSQPLATIPYILSPEEKSSRIKRWQLGLATSGSFALAACVGMNSTTSIAMIAEKAMTGALSGGVL